MINKSSNEFTLEKIYKNLESGMPENKSIKEYALPNARQWLGGRFVAIWVLPIYFLRKIAKLKDGKELQKKRLILLEINQTNKFNQNQEIFPDQEEEEYSLVNSLIPE